MPRISLVVLRCSSVEKALAFYRALGLEFVEERHGRGPVHYASTVGDTVLEIYPAASPVSVRHERVGFRVENLESVLAAVEQSGGSVESSSLHEGIRRAVIIDPDGIVRHATINHLPVGRSAREALRVLTGFQFVREHGDQVCPADWEEGQETMAANPQGMRDFLKKR